jgi:hypothetical protein
MSKFTTTIAMDEESSKAIKNIPREVSVSRIVRFIIKAIALQTTTLGKLTDDEFRAELDKNPVDAATRQWVRKRLKPLFMK